MSGGSFNYLCWCDDLRSIIEKRSYLDEMLETLQREHPGSEATRNTEQLVAALEALDEAVRVGVARLAPVWRAVEWQHSGDTTDVQTREAVEAYERKDGAK